MECCWKKYKINILAKPKKQKPKTKHTHTHISDERMRA